MDSRITMSTKPEWWEKPTAEHPSIPVELLSADKQTRDRFLHGEFKPSEIDRVCSEAGCGNESEDSIYGKPMCLRHLRAYENESKLHQHHWEPSNDKRVRESHVW